MINEKKNGLDRNTRQYIRGIRLLQVIVFVVMSMFFVLFVYRVISRSDQSLKEVALAEVQESMRETVNNISIYIDRTKVRLEKEAKVVLKDTLSRIEKSDVKEVTDVLAQLEVCEENQLGYAIQAIYRTSDETIYYIKNAGKESKVITSFEAEALYKDGLYERLEKNGKEIVLFLYQTDIDELVKQEIHTHIHSESYEGNQYVWVNEVIHMEGGENYAIRRIHPNLVESEGEYLSTSMQDIKGNYPYLTELEGIKKQGYIFHSYYFKNKINDEIMEKFSYSQYYEPFSWIISTGETLEEVYIYSEALGQQNLHQAIGLMIEFGILLVITFTLMIKILNKQANAFREKLLKQADILDDIYSTMAAGLLRIRMSEKESSLITINPKGLELFGIDTEEEFSARRKNHMIDTIVEEDRENLYQVYDELKEQWDSVAVECHVKWKDGTIHLLKVRNTLIEFDGDAKIIQRMCLDITEERHEQEMALLQAEEKATLDPMTQIKNKRAIEMITRKRIEEAVEQQVPIAVGFVDIDNFRDYNTRYGHLQGDEVIKHVASTLKETVQGDVGRTGGDEFTFCILNPSYQMVEDAMKEMHKKLNQGIAIMNTNIIISTPCSIGVVIVKGKELEYDRILKCSDKAMYCAKEKGKNTYYILEKEML